MELKSDARETEANTVKRVSQASNRPANERGTLYFGRNAGQNVLIGDDVIIRVRQFKSGVVHFGVAAPLGVPVDRKENFRRKQTVTHPSTNFLVLCRVKSFRGSGQLTIWNIPKLIFQKKDLMFLFLILT